MGAQWLSGRALDSRPKGRGFEPHRRYCIVSLSKNINPSLVLVQPRKNRPFITERLLMGHKESIFSNQTNKNKIKGASRGDLPVYNTISYTKMKINILSEIPNPFMGPVYCPSKEVIITSL